jgi:hypothetical protein
MGYESQPKGYEGHILEAEKLGDTALRVSKAKPRDAKPRLRSELHVEAEARERDAVCL